MKNFITIFAATLLLLNGVGAIYGGWNLILQPDGSSLQLSMNWLKHTPFPDYLIPGIVLFIANGVCSFFALGALWFNLPKRAWWVMAQGAILTGWIVVQIFLVRTVHFLHIGFGTVGLLLVLLGWLLLQYSGRSRSNQ